MCLCVCVVCRDVSIFEHVCVFTCMLCFCSVCGECLVWDGLWCVVYVHVWVHI